MNGPLAEARVDLRRAPSAADGATAILWALAGGRLVVGPLAGRGWAPCLE